MNSFWGNIFRSRGTSNPAEKILDILRRIPLFDGLSKKELSAIERILHKRTYQRQELIFRQGDPGLGMYIIERGSVEIVSGPANTLLAELHEGEFFGELALLDDSPRSASATAKEECTALGFFQPDLFGLVERNPKLGVKIVMRLARIIGDRLKKCNEELRRADDTGS